MLNRHLASAFILGLLAALLAFSPGTASAQTMVPGGNTGTATWTMAGSPYIVAGDLTVQAGAVLTIEQGVVVRFNINDALAAGTNTARIELTVRGTLVVNGTPGSPVTFQSVSGTAAGSWVGIILDSTATSATIANATIEHATTGLLSALGGTTLNLSATTFNRSVSGLVLAAGTPTIDRLTATLCSDSVTVQSTAAPTFTNALVTGSGSRAFVVSGGGTTTIENATIVGGSDCVFATSNLNLRDSIVTGCTDDGIDTNAGITSVTNSNVWGNATDFEAATAGAGTFSANPLFVSASNYRLTSNSPSRFSGTTGDDQGALPYISDATPGLYGTLWSNTTVAAGNTNVAGDLTVPPGVTLTLSPGATLTFATSDIMRAYGDIARAEFRVFGTLSAVGNAGAPITLTSAGASAGSWNGLGLEASSTGSALDYVTVDEANVAVRHSSTTAQSLRRLTVTRSVSGLVITTTPMPIDALTATLCSDSVTVQSGATPTFTNAIVTGSGSRGFVISAGSGTTNIENATIVGGSDCVFATSNLNLRDSIVTGCTDDGIDTNAGITSVTNSNVWGNATDFEAATAGAGTFSANPLFVSASNYRLTSNSPSRFSGTTGDDQGALPYISDATPGLYGTLWSNTTVAAGNTNVAGDLTVPPGVTLTLSPGATLTFATNDIMRAYGDIARAEFRVFGTLSAVGNAGAPIMLTSAGASAGSWNGLGLEASSTGSALDYVTIEEANVAVRHSSTTAQLLRRLTLTRSVSGLVITTTPMPIDALTATLCSDSVTVQSGATPTFTNALVTGSGSRGFVVSAGSGMTTIASSTISGGSDCVFATSNLAIINSIVTGCTDDGVDVNAGTTTVTYSDVWGNATNYEGVTMGTGSISANPLFVSASDFRLTASSVCIDSGAAMGPSTDRVGVARPLDGDGVGGAAHDMGAFEFVRTMICGDGVITAPEVCDDGASNGMYGRCNASCSGAGQRCGDGARNGPEACDDGNMSNTDACLNTCMTAACGDSFVQAGVESCDDGNAVTTDSCILCMNATCGDGNVRAGVEACDDGNVSSTDACVMCSNAFCGDGYVRMGVETCDDGNTSNSDACLNTCTAARCGDGFVGPGESCDDGNTIDGDGCSSTCRTASCGDGRVDAGEECDDGNMTNDDMCSNACRAARCGDGIRHSGEDCDDGNMVDDDMCSNTCRTARCGDGIVHAGEECDDGNTVSTDGCTASCTSARCGDGVVRTGMEECDDGNASNTDACVAGCVAAACGDTFVRSGVEACDDGNTTDGDGCSSSCGLMSCGDGIVQAGEACDDGNGSNTDACLNSCLAASCGDGQRQVGVEACDDGNGDDTDACLTTCRNASCGDGFTQSGTEECDDGNGTDTDDCVSSCESARCGDSFVQDGVESCDDGNDMPGDGCSASCMSEAGGPDAGTADAGSTGGDAGSSDSDSGIDPEMDAGIAAPDAGTAPASSGCGCRVGGGASGGMSAGLALMLLGLVGVRRRRR